jgi:membrane-associated phospholipid phosphatase
LNIQNGAVPSQVAVFQNEPRFLRTGRDLAAWVYKDFSYQAFLNAALVLAGYGPAALSTSNPYKDYTFESGFLTFGAPHILDWVSRVAASALKAAWYQKWLVHRRIRPEEFGGRVHNHLTKAAAYPIHVDLLNSAALDMVRAATGSYLLPQAFPEGCPAHPSYPAGHAIISGACATVLKALFNESFIFPDPVEVSPDGTELVPYSGDPLTIGGELNKLAANVSLSRDTAGLHYRSDSMGGLRLGEAVAISVIRDLASTLPEQFSDFTLATFDGVPIRISRVV